MLTIGEMFTAIRIGAIGMTSILRAQVVAIGPEGITYKGPRKRKMFRFQPDDDTMIFNGHDIPFKTDMEEMQEHGGCMRGNACFNFVGDRDTIRQYIDEKQLNPAFDGKANIVLCHGEEEEPLYPELETGHAVIRRMKEKAASAALV